MKQPTESRVSSRRGAGTVLTTLEEPAMHHLLVGCVAGDPPPPSQRREDKTMDNDLDQAKGRIKQAAGDLTDNPDLKREGKADEKAGKVKEFFDDVKDKLDEGVDKVKDRFHKD